MTAKKKDVFFSLSDLFYIYLIFTFLVETNYDCPHAIRKPIWLYSLSYRTLSCSPNNVLVIKIPNNKNSPNNVLV